MTIIADGRERAIECDECPEMTDPFDKSDFDLMVQTAKNDGWLIRFADGEWSHTCPSCKAGDRLAAARAKFGL